MKNLLSIDDISTPEILNLFKLAQSFRNNDPDTGRFLKKGKTVALIFNEPSTRTVLSFQKAVMNLQGTVLLLNMLTSSAQKGETLEDTLKTVSCYADAIILRQSKMGILKTISVDVPLINAGDGMGEHPTQSLIDLWTIYENKKRLNGLSILFVGDKNSRTVHSLVKLLERFEGNRCVFYEPLEDTIEEKMGEADVVYVTRYQSERCQEKPQIVHIDKTTMRMMRQDAILMHPLPRNEEMSPEVDDDPRSVIFDQVRNGVFIRMAILAKVL